MSGRGLQPPFNGIAGKVGRVSTSYTGGLGSNPGQGVLNLFHITQLLVSALLSLQLRIEGMRTEFYYLATSVSGDVS